MKRVTASDARKNWFRLLDEVAEGQVVCIERSGRKILLKRQPEEDADDRVPDYSQAIHVHSPEHAHEWGWEWPGPGQELRATDRDDG